MSNSEPSWPRFFRRISEAFDDGGSQPTTQTRPLPPPPPPPRRPENQQLYQPQPLWIDDGASSPAPPLPARPARTSIQELSQIMDAQQQAFDHAHQQQQKETAATGGNSNETRHPQRRNSLLRGSIRRKPVRDGSGSSEQSAAHAMDDRPPTTERVAEFRLDIPNGVRNMVQHPEDTIVGSVVVTVTKPTKARRIVLYFMGQQRVQLRDQSSVSPASIEYTLFDKQLVLWGSEHGAADDDSRMETLLPGTLVVPFSINLPRVNYPSTIKRDRVCRVRYVVWAVLERPGKLIDHTVATEKEELRLEPTVYPTCTKRALAIDKVIEKPRTPEEALASNVSVHLQGSISQTPAMPGERLTYQLDARVVGASAAPDSRHNYVIKRMRIVFVEKLKMRGLIRGQEHSHSHRTDIFTVKIASMGGSDGTKKADPAATYSAGGNVSVPLDVGAFDSKLLRREYEIRIECDVVDSASLLGKMTRQRATYAMRVPLEICDVSPDLFDSAAYMNSYTDESRNISSIAPPSHDASALEPELCAGGWELERSYHKWNADNPCWRQLAERKAAGS
ncbi:hypothetical protein GGH99_005102 [Coemansia sp. RSA 1285]|nr:hypothetical protein GGH99_005102 [Coemansia sp. RSA 1285]